ncbi:hypothetical protein V8C42DRAFT_336859 [Trichoderma barbatum]
MDYNKIFKDLSLAPLSYDSLTLAFTALRVIQRRYPNFTVTEDGNLSVNSSENSGLSDIPFYWTEYAYNCSFALDQKPDEKRWCPKLKDNTPVHPEVVTEYLKLLRKPPSMELVNTITIKEGTYNIYDEGIDRPTIIPLKISDNGKDAWAFIVAYSDCIHYYNGGNNDSTSNIIDKHTRPVKIGGPKAEHEYDSGIYMLLGIRRILDGIPHISQQAATPEVVSNFRVRILVELLCKKMDPSMEDFQAFCEKEDIVMPSALQENLLQSSSAPTPNLQSYPSFTRKSTSPVVGEDYIPQDTLLPIEEVYAIYTPTAYSNPMDILQPTEEGHATFSSNSTPKFSGTLSGRQSTAATSVNVSSPPRPRLSFNVQNTINTMKGILNLLSTAAFTCRISNTSKKTSLAILWHSINKDHSESKFHQRYNEVLFYDKMEALRSDDAIKTEMNERNITPMKLKKKNCKFWKDVCDIGEGLGWKDENKYVMLLAISSLPANESQRKEILSHLRSRLDDGSDQLRNWLLSAHSLCTSIVKQELPEENLMIDLYYLKKHNNIDEETYKSFMSLNSHVAMEIPRIN